MAGPTDLDGLFPDHAPPEGTVVVTDRCLMRTREGRRVVIVSGIVLAQYALGDRMAEAYAMVSLVEQGWADPNDVARAFDCSARTVRRHERRFAEGGLAALGRRGGYPEGRPRLRPSRIRRVSQLKAEGASNCAIAERLGVSEKAVRKLLRRLGWRARPPEQAALPFPAPSSDSNLSASSERRSAEEAAAAEPSAGGASTVSDPNLSAFSGEDPPVSWDSDPADRRCDRLLAYLGLLDDAAPPFRPGSRLPRTGVLLALPPLLESGVLEVAREIYGGIGPAF